MFAHRWLDSPRTIISNGEIGTWKSNLGIPMHIKTPRFLSSFGTDS